jgi:hypothetical protein
MGKEEERTVKQTMYPRIQTVVNTQLTHQPTAFWLKEAERAGKAGAKKHSTKAYASRMTAKISSETPINVFLYT